jgi:hypothetical protein
MFELFVVLRVLFSNAFENMTYGTTHNPPTQLTQHNTRDNNTPTQLTQHNTQHERTQPTNSTHAAQHKRKQHTNSTQAAQHTTRENTTHQLKTHMPIETTCIFNNISNNRRPVSSPKILTPDDDHIGRSMQ